MGKLSLLPAGIPGAARRIRQQFRHVRRTLCGELLPAYGTVCMCVVTSPSGSGNAVGWGVEDDLMCLVVLVVLSSGQVSQDALPRWMLIGPATDACGEWGCLCIGCEAWVALLHRSCVVVHA